MPLHPQFQARLNEFREEYGDEEGERRFWAWVNSCQFDETRPLEGQKCRRREGLFQFTYHADVQSYEGDKKRYAKVFLIDSTTINRLGWGVTSEATRKALASLARLPLLGPPEKAHEAGARKVGDFLSYVSNGVTYGIYEVTDDEAWRKIRSGEWKHTSPRIIAYRRERLPSGQELITDYRFDHLAFCLNPAFPAGHDGVVSTCEGCPESCRNVFARSFSAAFEAAFQGYKKACNDVASSLRVGTQDAEKNSFIENKESDSMESTTSLRFSAAVLPYHESPKASEDESWDFNAGEYDVDQLRRACAWFDSENPDVKNSYKLPHHRPNGTVVWRGVAAAMAVLMGGRGGVDIPADDRRGVYNHLSKHYGDFDKEPPEYSASIKEVKHLSEEEKQRIADLEAKAKKFEAEAKKLQTEKQDLETKLADLEKEGKEKEGTQPLDKLQAELRESNEERKKLEKRIAAMEEEKHLNFVSEIVDLRIAKGVVDQEDRESEIERLKGLDGKTLTILKEDTVKVAEKIEALMPEPTPKAKFTAEAPSKSTERVREALYGYRRDDAGKIIGGA